jgi:hypothetical protein
MKLLSVVLCQLAFTAGIFSQAPVGNVYEVYAIEYAASKGSAALKTVAVGATTGDSTTFSYYVWFLKGDNGRCVLLWTPAFCWIAPLQTSSWPDMSGRILPFTECT